MLYYFKWFELILLLFILNVTLFSILFTYIVIEGLTVTASSYSAFKTSQTFYGKYNPSLNSNSLFHVGADILNLLSLLLYYFYR